jgi:hypothetical protein
MNSSYRPINYTTTDHSLLPVHTEIEHNIVITSTGRKISGGEKQYMDDKHEFCFIEKPYYTYPEWKKELHQNFLEIVLHNY